MKALFDDLVYLPDETFSTEVDHALALFGIADNPDLHYSGAAIRRFGRPRPAAVVVSACAPPPSGMRVSFGPRSITRLEVFYVEDFEPRDASGAERHPHARWWRRARRHDHCRGSRPAEPADSGAAVVQIRVIGDT